MQGMAAFLKPALNYDSFCRSLSDPIHYFFSCYSGGDGKNSPINVLRGMFFGMIKESSLIEI